MDAVTNGKLCFFQRLPFWQTTVCCDWQRPLRVASSFFWCTPGEHFRVAYVHSLHQWLTHYSLIFTPMLIRWWYQMLYTSSVFLDSSYLQEDLDQICNWSSWCNLNFNVSTCCLIHFFNRRTPHHSTYLLDGAEFPTISHCWDVGIVFSINLSWSLQYDSTSARAYRNLGLICQTFSSSLSKKVKELLYVSLVWSLITYCSQIWRPYLINDITFLKKTKDGQKN